MASTLGIRARARQELVREITDVARRHLAEHGAGGLSVRAVTRELGMAPSAVYRYFPSRDALLTALIIDAYEGVGEAARVAEEPCPRDDHAGRWLAVFRAVRQWGLAHPHEYALIYGSPVPGYRAPEDTVVPATGVVLRLARIAVDAGRGPGLDPAPAPPLSAALRADARDRAADAAATMPDDVAAVLTDVEPIVVVAVIDAWTLLFGAVSFELFGHYHRTVEARADHLDHLARTSGRAVGIPGL
ncbi:TetR/AcrR family transcriptional regulator [Georgenia sp. SYP-B2076]|uniref:TetR/AcrR family transcriptional regulator n=1 Tax=Georgenia sp. SYP-B2076 TaxID=2495881 RepID=UPI000F8EAF17|nr:TetR/AcrR family transcriptional regulator [Georgenia sp. SYP-B2076]